MFKNIVSRLCITLVAIGGLGIGSIMTSGAVHAAGLSNLRVHTTSVSLVRPASCGTHWGEVGYNGISGPQNGGWAASATLYLQFDCNNYTTGVAQSCAAIVLNGLGANFSGYLIVRLNGNKFAGTAGIIDEVDPSFRGPGYFSWCTGADQTFGTAESLVAVYDDNGNYYGTATTGYYPD